MADLVITAGSVTTTSTDVESGTAGATITAGQVVYKDTSDSNKFKLADANSATAAIRSPYGIALNGASTGQPLAVQKTGDITIGATVGVGTVYILSGTPGGIALGCPGTTDLVTGWYTSVLGIGISTTVIKMKIVEGGVAMP